MGEGGGCAEDEETKRPTTLDLLFGPASKLELEVEAPLLSGGLGDGDLQKDNNDEALTTATPMPAVPATPVTVTSPEGEESG